MNILQVPNYYINNSQRKNSAMINFGCNKTNPSNKLSDSSLLNDNEIVEHVCKLVNKIKFVSEILGENGKTIKPILVKLGDAPVYIKMDKSQKDNIKISLFSDTIGSLYEYSDKLQDYIPVKKPEMIRQNIDIILNKKDKRMIDGQLGIVDCYINFIRDTKTGKREMHSNKCFYFVPNLYECKDIEDLAVQFWQNDKAANIVTSTFFNVFANLTKVKPEISLIK